MTPNKNILIIDDDDRNIFALRAVLSSRGYHCKSANSGEEALTILRENIEIQIALVDMMMPGMDGYELMSHVRADASLTNVKLIAVTAQAMTGDREKCFAAGADAYVSKPVNVDELQKYL